MDPFNSTRRAFLRPVAQRVASNEASAPEASRAVNTTASSTVTVPVPVPPVFESAAQGRDPVKVALTADTPVTSSPVR